MMAQITDKPLKEDSDLNDMFGEDEVCTVGFDAICDALKKIYGEQEGNYHRAMIPYCLGGDSPLDGVEVYLCHQERAHWHYITYGFSDLFENEHPESTESGFGFELTFRLLKGSEDSAPKWPINFLQNLAYYVFESGNPFDEGHHIDANGPIALDEDTELTAVGFALDPVLGQMDTENGSVKFLQLCALTHDEMMAMMCSQGDLFLASLGKYIPLNICDLSRGSLMENESFVSQWESLVEDKGSSTGVLYLNRLYVFEEGGKVIVRLPFAQAQIIGTMIGARLLKERHLLLVGVDQALDLKLGAFAFSKGDENQFELTLQFEDYDNLVSQFASYVKSGANSLEVFDLPSAKVSFELIV